MTKACAHCSAEFQPRLGKEHLTKYCSKRCRTNRFDASDKGRACRVRFQRSAKGREYRTSYSKARWKTHQIKIQSYRAANRTRLLEAHWLLNVKQRLGFTPDRRLLSWLRLARDFRRLNWPRLNGGTRRALACLICGTEYRPLSLCKPRATCSEPCRKQMRLQTITQSRVRAT